MGVGAAAGETPSLTGEVVGETHRGLECAQAHLSEHRMQEMLVCVSPGCVEASKLRTCDLVTNQTFL